MRYKIAWVYDDDYKNCPLYTDNDLTIQLLKEGENIVVIDTLKNEAIGVLTLAPCCRHGYYPYCPKCPHGSEYISETEAEFFRIDEECSTEWVCCLDDEITANNNKTY